MVYITITSTGEWLKDSLNRSSLRPIWTKQVNVQAIFPYCMERRRMVLGQNIHVSCRSGTIPLWLILSLGVESMAFMIVKAYHQAVVRKPWMEGWSSSDECCSICFAFVERTLSHDRRLVKCIIESICIYAFSYHVLWSLHSSSMLHHLNTLCHNTTYFSCWNTLCVPTIPIKWWCFGIIRHIIKHSPTLLFIATYWPFGKRRDTNDTLSHWIPRTCSLWPFTLTSLSKSLLKDPVSEYRPKGRLVKIIISWLHVGTYEGSAIKPELDSDESLVLRLAYLKSSKDRVAGIHW